MPETPGHHLQRLVRSYRCAVGCYRLLPDAGNVGSGAAFLNIRRRAEGCYRCYRFQSLTLLYATGLARASCVAARRPSRL